MTKAADGTLYGATVYTGHANFSAAVLAEGALQLLPLPGRYLSAPSPNASVVSVRLAGTSTALCAKPDSAVSSVRASASCICSSGLVGSAPTAMKPRRAVQRRPGQGTLRS